MSGDGEEPLVPSRTQLQEEYAGLREDLGQMGGRVDASRTFGVVAVGAALALAVQQHLALVAIGGAALAHCFALLDLTNSHRLAVFAGRARRVELALEGYDEHERLKDSEAHEQLQTRLDALGKRPWQLVLNEPGRHEMHFTYPRAVFRLLYPAMVGAGGILAIVLQCKKGSEWSTGAVCAVVLALWAYSLPAYLDPSRPPLRWWDGVRGGDRVGRLRAAALFATATAALVVAVVLLWPVFRHPPRQHPGLLAVSLTPAVRDVSVRLALKPACSPTRATVQVHWTGAGEGLLTVRLPRNLRPAGRSDERVVTVATRGDSALLALRASPSAGRAGRCTFALPVIVGSGQAASGQVSVSLSADVRLEGQQASGYLAPPGALGECEALRGGAAARTCAGVLQLEAHNSASTRLTRLALAAALILFTVLLICGRLLAGQRATKRPRPRIAPQ
ncbi:MAG: hypothetical protein ACYDHT_10145 [Solirubrobacteraceae bacterium]